MTKTDQKIPVTELSAEQAPAYEAVSESKEIKTTNLKTEQTIMEAETTNQISVNPPVLECQSLQDGCPVPLEHCLGGTYLAGTRAGTIVANPNLKEWDGKDLKEGVVYHRNELLGLPLCSIKENRDSLKRGKDWQKICRNNGMVNPGVFVKATVVKEAGFTPVISGLPISKSLLPYFYVPMDGYGRLSGHDLDLEEAMKDPAYKPFDFTFIFKELKDPNSFFKQYQSVNLEVKKTTRSELLKYTSCHKSSSILTEYYKMVGEGFVAKAVAYYIFGRELKKDDIKKVCEGNDITVEQDLVDCMGMLLETYKDVFSGTSSQKLLKGVPLARWTRDTLKNATNMEAIADKIKGNFSSMSPQLLGRLQDAKGVRGDRARTTEIILTEIFYEILNS